MSKRLQVIVPVSIAAFALGGGIAWATIPDSSNVIHGCYKTGSGDLRVIDPSAGGSCHAAELSLNWPGAENVVLRSHTQSVDPSEASTFSVFCHPGERATGGGYRLLPGFSVPDLLPLMTAQGSIPIYSGHSEPQDGDTPDGWKVIGALNRDTTAHDATVFVVCESP